MIIRLIILTITTNVLYVIWGTMSERAKRIRLDTDPEP